MALQLISRYDTDDFDAWHGVFRSERETMGHAGLSVLQIWREPDRPATAWVLWRVNDRSAAAAFLAGEARAGAERAGVRDAVHHFVQTV